jgi:hypothetical protein
MKDMAPAAQSPTARAVRRGLACTASFDARDRKRQLFSDALARERASTTVASSAAHFRALGKFSPISQDDGDPYTKP